MVAASHLTGQGLSSSTTRPGRRRKTRGFGGGPCSGSAEPPPQRWMAASSCPARAIRGLEPMRQGPRPATWAPRSRSVREGSRSMRKENRMHIFWTHSAGRRLFAMVGCCKLTPGKGCDRQPGDGGEGPASERVGSVTGRTRPRAKSLGSRSPCSPVLRASPCGPTSPLPRRPPKCVGQGDLGSRGPYLVFASANGANSESWRPCPHWDSPASIPVIIILRLVTSYIKSLFQGKAFA